MAEVLSMSFSPALGRIGLWVEECLLPAVGPPLPQCWSCSASTAPLLHVDFFIQTCWVVHSGLRLLVLARQWAAWLARIYFNHISLLWFFWEQKQVMPHWEEALWFAVSLHLMLTLLLEKCIATGPCPEQGPHLSFSLLADVSASSAFHFYHTAYKPAGPEKENPLLLCLFSSQKRNKHPKTNKACSHTLPAQQKHVRAPPELMKLHRKGSQFNVVPLL